MKIFANVLKKGRKALSHSTTVSSASRRVSNSIFETASQSANKVSQAVRVSDEEIARLLNQGVTPLKYTFTDIVRLAGRKIISPFKGIKDYACYCFKRRFAKLEVPPSVRITEAELPDCLKGIL